MLNTPRRLVAAAVLALVCLAVSATGAAAQTPPPAPETTMKAGLLMELESGAVLWSRNASERRAPASLTKVMTALVVLENAGLNDTAVISPAARRVDGQRMFAEQGWQMTVGDMLWGLLLQSGNDAAVALAEKASPDGSIDGFMHIVNARAAELGTTGTTLHNPHGLDEPGHLSTAHDLALITSAALQHPTFAQMVGAKTHIVPWGDGNPHLLINHNKLLWRYDGTVGVKTGFTDGAGPSLISAVRRNGSTLISVVLGSANHYGDSTALYDWGFAHLDSLKSGAREFIRPDLTTDFTQLSVGDAEPAGASGSSPAGTQGVKLHILFPALGLVLLVSLAMVRRYSPKPRYRT